MAALALGFGMLSKQRKCGGVMVELRWLFPASFGVTTGAILAQCLLVFVVFLVAGVAVLAQLVFEQVACMAVLAHRAAVLATQRKLRIGVVVEAGSFPLLCGVATLAPFTKAPAVSLLLIVFPVARHTGQRRAFVRTSFVAIGAFGLHMLAHQGKARGIVVKLGVLPGRLRMAVRALGTQ